MAEQLRLLRESGSDPSDPYYVSVWDRLLAYFNETVTVIGVKQAAADLDTSPSVLKHALCERERHEVKARWVPYLLRKAPNDEPAALLVSVRGLEICQQKTMTPEQELAALRAALATTVGPEVQRIVEQKVRSSR
jgi:hypothetical protein